jgi:pilus assembly protein Flp/PilA
MSKALILLKRLAKDEEGTALMEYTILLSIIAVAVIGVAAALGGWITTTWSTLCTNLAKKASSLTCP